MSANKKRFSIYSTKPIQSVIRSLENDQGLTSRLSEIVERYQMLCTTPPQMAEYHLEALKALVNDSYLSPHDIKNLPTLLRDRNPELAEAVQSLNLHERIALIESL